MGNHIGSGQTGETSIFASFAPEIVKFLLNAGAAAEELHLPDLGIRGNGHGLIYELNSDEALQPVLNWLDKQIPQQGGSAGSIPDKGDYSKCTVLVIYEGVKASRFDRKYYKEKHIPMLHLAWAKYGLEKVEDLYPSDEKGGIVAMAVCTFRSRAAADTAFSSPESKAVMADIINYTDITPLRRMV